MALLTLSLLEIVLGVDNIIFISILAGRLPEEQRARARNTGLALALGTRVLLLLFIGQILGLTQPLFQLPFLDVATSGKDLILIGGGLFLLGKSTYEIHHKLEGDEHTEGGQPKYATFTGTIVQILLLDIVFSLDSVITAVGIGEAISLMIVAVFIAIIFMLAFAGPISAFVERHPTVKMLALSFLLLIGFTLVAEGFHVEIPKGYIYFAMAFSVLVELLNLRLRTPKKEAPVKLHNPPYAPVAVNPSARTLATTGGGVGLAPTPGDSSVARPSNQQRGPNNNRRRRR